MMLSSKITAIRTWTCFSVIATIARGEIPEKSWTEKFSVQAYIPVYFNFISLNPSLAL
jgi:hypothetical protein